MELIIVGVFLSVFLLVVLGILGLWVHMFTRVARYGGIKGAIFGGQVTHTFGELTLPRDGIVRTTVRVHRIERPGGATIGIEVVHTTPISYRSTPLRLEPEGAQWLLQTLQGALQVL